MRAERGVESQSVESAISLSGILKEKDAENAQSLLGNKDERLRACREGASGKDVVA